MSKSKHNCKKENLGTLSGSEGAKAAFMAQKKKRRRDDSKKLETFLKKSGIGVAGSLSKMEHKL